MASRAFEGLEVEELAFLAQETRLSPPVRASLVCRVVELSPSEDMGARRSCESDAREGSCLVGAAWALALEAATLFAIRGMWNLFHLLH